MPSNKKTFEVTLKGRRNVPDSTMRAVAAKTEVNHRGDLIIGNTAFASGSWLRVVEVEATGSETKEEATP
jgi:hypothetical protein